MKLTAIAKSLVVVFVVVAAAAGATYAIFSDTATIGDSTFSTGTADLKIWDPTPTPGAWAETTEGFTTPALLPGQSADPFHFRLRNFNNATMDVRAELTPDPAVAGLGDWVRVKFECDTTPGGPYETTTGEWTVNQWIAGSDMLPDLPGGQAYECRLMARLDAGAPNAVQGQNLTFGALFTGMIPATIP